MKHDFEITEKLPVEFKKKWVEALNSGEYPQGEINLYNSEKDCYCCIGVAGIVCGIPLEKLDNYNFISKIFEANLGEDLPIAMNLLKMKACDDEANLVVMFLTNANDTGSTFEEIADWIEENL